MNQTYAEWVLAFGMYYPPDDWYEALAALLAERSPV